MYLRIFTFTLWMIFSSNIFSEEQMPIISDGFSHSIQNDFQQSHANKIHKSSVNPIVLPSMKPTMELQKKPDISMNFQKIEIAAALQLLAEFTGTNIIVSSRVTGFMTLRLDKLPWEQALDVILTTQGLEKIEKKNVIWVDSKKNTADQNVDELENQKPLLSELIGIHYAKAAEIASMLKQKENSLLSLRGSVNVDTRTNSLWIQDTSKQIQRVRKLIEKLDIAVRQVEITSRIVAVDRGFTQDLGIRFSSSKPGVISGTMEGLKSMQNSTSNDVKMTDGLNLDFMATRLAMRPATLGIALARLGSDILLDLELSAMESESKGQIIASPRLVTSDQQPAKIESGTEIPYEESASGGATAVTFKKAALSLSVTPQITPDNKIMMQLKINQDRPVFLTDGNKIPAIDTRQITTNVLVNNGQTIVLGGIYQQDKRRRIKRVPFFGDLPMVGHLFRNRAIEIKNEELLIFITPKIVDNSY